jgi:hypothetical protein
MVIKVRGILDFTPEDFTEKHRSQSVWKRVAIIKTDCELERYYAWFLKKRFNLELNSSLRGTHVTFISDRLEKELFDQAAVIFNKKEIDFYIELEPRSNGEHWWLRVHCPEAENIREVLGLSREPFFGMHLTLGRAISKVPEGLVSSSLAPQIKRDYLEHSKYILECCKEFSLLSNDVRVPLSEHEIITF